MKWIKIYLIVVTILLIAGIGIGVYVWYTLQKFDTTLDIKASDVSQDTQKVVVPATAPTASTSATKTTQKNIVIETAKLSESQQTVLKTVGFEGSTFTITPPMISCAEDAVGKERLEAIIAGSTPSPFESMKLIPCFNT